MHVGVYNIDTLNIVYLRNIVRAIQVCTQSFVAPEIPNPRFNIPEKPQARIADSGDFIEIPDLGFI